MAELGGVAKTNIHPEPHLSPSPQTRPKPDQIAVEHLFNPTDAIPKFRVLGFISYLLNEEDNFQLGLFSLS